MSLMRLLARLGNPKYRIVKDSSSIHLNSQIPNFFLFPRFRISCRRTTAMDSGSQVPRRSKRKFQPRPQTISRRPIAPSNNTKAEDEEENIKAAQRIAKRIGVGHRKPKTETKASSSEVAFQHDFSSLAIRSFGVPKEDGKRGSDVKPSSSADILPTVSPATAREDGEEVHNLVTRTKEDYVGPWDYGNSYYPTVLPLRKPNSGDPELLDQEEFGELAKHRDYVENTINSAEELGLTSEQHCKKQMFFFKIPESLPVKKQLTGANTKRLIPEYSSKRSNPFEGLPEGFMGKMQVYKSGAVKLKLGDVLFDVLPGPNAKFHNDVAAIDTKGRSCCRIGSSAKFVTVTPDVESLLNSATDMETNK